jgi:para-aminobenzoate synthetase component I
LKAKAWFVEKINKYAHEAKSFLFLVDFDLHQMHFFDELELSHEHIHVSFPNLKTTPIFSTHEKTIELKPKLLSFENYKKQFDKVMQGLLYGNSFLTNLTMATPIETKSSLANIFTASDAKYKLLFKDEWVCFSPETFIKITDGKIYSFPMKGTIDANFPNAKETILHDEKEIAEHYTIVDLIRNDLSRVAQNVRVEKFRYVEKIKATDKELLQVSSKIVGDLPKNYQAQLAETLFALLPAGSISGAPKKKTLEIIHDAENYQRGFYTGVAFHFDGKNLDSCVLIRFIENIEGELFYKSGGGITINSDAEKEYQELIQKIYVPII